jgi:hypothetical protein
MKRKKFIKVQGKVYLLLGMYGGVAHLGLPFDVNNESVERCVIWEKQPFYNETEFGFKDRAFVQLCLLVRYFKTDVFDNSGFKTFYKSLMTKFG